MGPPAPDLAGRLLGLLRSHQRGNAILGLLIASDVIAARMFQGRDVDGHVLAAVGRDEIEAFCCLSQPQTI